jgi:hypothetical protein
MAKTNIPLSEKLKGRENAETPPNSGTPISAIRAASQTSEFFVDEDSEALDAQQLAEERRDCNRVFLTEEIAAPEIKVFLPRHAGHLQREAKLEDFENDGSKNEQIIQRVGSLLMDKMTLEEATESAAALFNVEISYVEALIQE